MPSKANPAEQRNFYENTLKSLMNDAKSGKIQLFFVDASHFVMGGFVGVIWAKVRRMVKTASGRSRYNVLGALNFVTKKVETITNDSYIRSDSVIALINLLITNSIGVPIKLILDNASYQRCNLVKEYLKYNFRLFMRNGKSSVIPITQKIIKKDIHVFLEPIGNFPSCFKYFILNGGKDF